MKEVYGRFVFWMGHEHDFDANGVIGYEVIEVCEMDENGKTDVFNPNYITTCADETAGRKAISALKAYIDTNDCLPESEY
jgi:hypothetical protein